MPEEEELITEGHGAVNTQESLSMSARYQRLLAHYGAIRARRLLETFRLLEYSNREALLAQGVRTQAGLEAECAALRAAGVALPVIPDA